MTTSPLVLHATTNFGDPTSKGMGYKIQRAACPVPGCTWIGDLTVNNTFPWHCNTHKWTCDSTGLSLQLAANLQVDEHGHLVGVDEMKKVEL
jgi:hypothetical protein